MLHMRPGFRENIRNAVTPTINSPGLSISTAQSRFGGGAIYNNGTNSCMNVAPVSAGALGSGDFTIEFWYYPNTVAGGVSFYGTRPLSTNGPYPTIYLNGAAFVLYTQGAFKITATTNITANAWWAFALVRSAGTTKMYLNGTQTGPSYADTNNYLASTCIMFGDDYNAGSGSNLNGYCNEFRISNIARYTANYTPATQPFVDDLNTTMLFHFCGSSGSTTIVDDNT